MTNLYRLMYGPKMSLRDDERNESKADGTDGERKTSAATPGVRKGILTMPELTHAVYRLTDDLRRVKAENEFLKRELARLRRAVRSRSKPRSSSDQ